MSQKLFLLSSCLQSFFYFFFAHTQCKAKLSKNFFDLIKRFLSEIAVFQHLVLALCCKFPDRGNVRTCNTVGRTDRKLDLAYRKRNDFLDLLLLDLVFFPLFLKLDVIFLIINENIQNNFNIINIGRIMITWRNT